MTDIPASQAKLPRHIAATIGYWAALIAAILTILFAAFAILFTAPEWHGIDDFASRFNPIYMASYIPAFLLCPTFVVVLACLHYIVPPEKKLYTLAGIAFASVYTAIISVNYYLPLFVLRFNLQAGELEGMGMFVMTNFYSVWFALEVLGYAFQGLATLAVSQAFVAPAGRGGRLESWIRWLLIINGVYGIFGLVVALFDRPMIIIFSIAIWAVTFIAAMILLAVYFRREMSRAASASG